MAGAFRADALIHSGGGRRVRRNEASGGTRRVCGRTSTDDQRWLSQLRSGRSFRDHVEIRDVNVHARGARELTRAR